MPSAQDGVFLSIFYWATFKILPLEDILSWDIMFTGRPGTVCSYWYCSTWFMGRRVQIRFRWRRLTKIWHYFVVTLTHRRAPTRHQSSLSRPSVTVLLFMSGQSGPVSVWACSEFTGCCIRTGTHIENSRSGKEAAVMDGEWEFAGLFITWLLGVGQAQDGAALGWTDASPKRNHRISST